MKKLSRQNRLLEILKNQGTGVVNISDAILSTFLDVSEATVRRDLKEMHNDRIIITESKLIGINGLVKTQRDITLKGEIQRKFSLGQHNQLRDLNNHTIEHDGEWIWMRRIDDEWSRNMIDKEFHSERQIWQWIYSAMRTHHNSYINGDKFSR